MSENFIMRGDLPPNIPERMRRLPLSDRGYPVPWFVEWIEEEGSNKPMPVGQGYPDFRIMRGEARSIAVAQKRCWICGQPLGSYMSFVVGPMCAVNRTSAEPPSHRDCAEWSAIACPFLSRPKMVRRKAGMIDEPVPPPGTMIERNPGVALVWTTRSYRVFNDPHGGQLIELGEPTDVGWYAHGRKATREEIEESIATGMPLLEASLESEPEDRREAGRAELQRRRDAVTPLLPA